MNNHCRFLEWPPLLLRLLLDLTHAVSGATLLTIEPPTPLVGSAHHGGAYFVRVFPGGPIALHAGVRDLREERVPAGRLPPGLGVPCGPGGPGAAASGPCRRGSGGLRHSSPYRLFSPYPALEYLPLDHRPGHPCGLRPCDPPGPPPRRRRFTGARFPLNRPAFSSGRRIFSAPVSRTCPSAGWNSPCPG